MNRTALIAVVLGLAISVQLGASLYAAWTAHNAATTNARTIRALEAEVAKRIRERRAQNDQTCTLAEKAHLADVQQLRDTYRYLKTGKLAELRPFVLANLPLLERKARTDDAPAFCDTDKLGLPEPDPVVPKRPRSLGP